MLIVFFRYMSNKLILPNSRPIEDPTGLWKIQCELMQEAENLLGPRSKKLYQPSFDSNGPFVCNTPNLDGAFAKLSLNAKNYWPTVIFELAHETIHLLDPKVGNTNWFEEGIAVHFSLHAQKLYKCEIQFPERDAYQSAFSLVNDLTEAPFSLAKELRACAGTLFRVDLDILSKFLPNLNPETAQKAVSVFTST